MKKIFAVAALFCMVGLLSVSTAFADWDMDDVNSAVNKIRQGQGVNEWGNYPSSHLQVISFGAAGINYVIDVRMKICYARAVSSQGNGGLLMVSCKALKEAYPLMAPIITWER
ncbi:MAG TPA: hypothetical protein PK544_18410 [Spirochaetota bacterium]|nr:hypothetical protein [Spirochaetota bacterium]